jgi:hypothetical protein
MLVFGTKAVHLQTVELEEATCPSCGEIDTVNLSVFRKHAHIFWIPVVPIGKIGVAECEHCKRVMKYSEMSQELKSEYNALKDEKKGPIWQFSGLVLIIGIVIMSSFLSSNNKKENLEYLANPMLGDVYEYKIEAKSYSTMKVVRVAGDSIFVAPNEYETNKISGLYEIDKEENYSEFVFGMEKERVQEMFDEGDIIDVNRR